MGGIGPQGPGDPGLVDPGAVGADTPLPGSPAGSPQFLIEEDPNGKYVVLGVRDFGGQMSSYLRLGSASTLAGQWDPVLGEDLACLVQGFADDARDRGASAPTRPPRTTLDSRSPAASSSIDARRAESIVLHTKGGWRDHTDGNRVTTTRGDKVEVIRGNYKLVVLGRRSPAEVLAEAIGPRDAAAQQVMTDAIAANPLLAHATVSSAARDGAVQELLHQSAGCDLSGGLNDYGDDVHGDAHYASTPDWPDPAWRPPAPSPPVSPAPPPPPEPVPGPEGPSTRGTTNSGAAPFDERFLCVEYAWRQDSHGQWVWEKRTTRGQETPIADGKPHLYRVINNNYIDYYENTLGSTSNAVNEVLSNVHASSAYTGLHFSDANRSLTTALAMINGNAAGLILTQVAAAATFEVDAAAAIAKAQVAVGNITVQLPVTVTVNAGSATDAHVGEHLDMHLGAHLESHVGLHVDSHAGVHFEVRVGQHTDMHFGTHLSFEMDHQEVHESQTFSANAGGHLQVRTVSGDSTTISEFHTEVTAEVITQVATQHHLI